MIGAVGKPRHGYGNAASRERERECEWGEADIQRRPAQVATQLKCKLQPAAVSACGAQSTLPGTVALEYVTAILLLPVYTRARTALPSVGSHPLPRPSPTHHIHVTTTSDMAH
ncbi:hypothetical protein KC19_1G013600 [Ceratodon purpureus]|uniref:Uncharacterized protein n=1 Tax=Ceratodon purpureus TaxID=3225 RepID=A0A8T0J036_CERPU|nr:hypothetical protein KC19_1G013600 [Ceratodon purpureus]